MAKNTKWIYPKGYCSITEAAKLLGVTRQWFSILEYKGDIKVDRHSERFPIVSLDEIDRYKRWKSNKY